MSTEPVDRPNTEIVRVRQGTGPRNMLLVLFVSLVLAVIVGAVVIGYFVSGN